MMSGYKLITGIRIKKDRYFERPASTSLDHVATTGMTAKATTMKMQMTIIPAVIPLLSVGISNL